MLEKMKRESAGFYHSEFLKMFILGLGTMALAACVPTVAATAKGGSETQSSKQKKDSYKMSFIQVESHTLSEAWAQGIQDVTDVRQNINYEQLDGQADPATQISLLDTAISEGVDAIFLQLADSVALGPSIKKAREAGIPVITMMGGITDRVFSTSALNCNWWQRE